MSDPIHSNTTTEGIRIEALASYMPEHSTPGQNRYFFSYRIVITNEGTDAAQLLTRHWVIIDSHGERTDVRGSGVVGHTPRLSPGERFEYTSFCPLNTDFGTIEGSYQMRKDDGHLFDVKIGRFYLAANAPQAELPEELGVVGKGSS